MPMRFMVDKGLLFLKVAKRIGVVGNETWLLVVDSETEHFCNSVFSFKGYTEDKSSR